MVDLRRALSNVDWSRLIDDDIRHWTDSHELCGAIIKARFSSIGHNSFVLAAGNVLVVAYYETDPRLLGTDFHGFQKIYHVYVRGTSDYTFVIQRTEVEDEPSQAAV